MLSIYYFFEISNARRYDFKNDSKQRFIQDIKDNFRPKVQNIKRLFGTNRLRSIILSDLEDLKRKHY